MLFPVIKGREKEMREKERRGRWTNNPGWVMGTPHMSAPFWDSKQIKKTGTALSLLLVLLHTLETVHFSSWVLKIKTRIREGESTEHPSSFWKGKCWLSQSFANICFSDQFFSLPGFYLLNPVNGQLIAGSFWVLTRLPDPAQPGSSPPPTKPTFPELGSSTRCLTEISVLIKSSWQLTAC